MFFNVGKKSDYFPLRIIFHSCCCCCNPRIQKDEKPLKYPEESRALETTATSLPHWERRQDGGCHSSGYRCREINERSKAIWSKQRRESYCFLSGNCLVARPRKQGRQGELCIACQSARQGREAIGRCLVEVYFCLGFSEPCLGNRRREFSMFCLFVTVVGGRSRANKSLDRWILSLYRPQKALDKISKCSRFKLRKTNKKQSM